VSDPEWWSTADLRQKAGVPQRQILLEANYLPDDVDTWLADQEENLTLSNQVALLERLGAAIQTLSAGVAVGMMSQENVAELVNRIIGVKMTPPPPELMPGAAPGDDEEEEEEQSERKSA
jgi:hypothetical protein